LLLHARNKRFDEIVILLTRRPFPGDSEIHVTIK
jgi:hypothetical protein